MRRETLAPGFSSASLRVGMALGACVSLAACLPRIRTVSDAGADAVSEAAAGDDGGAEAGDAPSLDAADVPSGDAADAADTQDVADVTDVTDVTDVPDPTDAADAQAPMVTLRAVSSTCLVPSMPRTVSVSVGSLASDGAVRVSVVGLPTDGSIEAGTVDFAAPSAEPRALTLRLSRAPSVPGARVMARLRAAPSVGAPLEVPFALQLGRCPGFFDERFNPTGVQPGALPLPVPMAYASEPYALWQDPEGRILTSGPVSTSSPWWATRDGLVDTGVWRVLPEGRLDPTFNPRGVLPGFVALDVYRSETVYSVLSTPSGLQVYVDYVSAEEPTREAIVQLRTSRDGELDTTFGAPRPDGTRPGYVPYSALHAGSNRDVVIASFLLPDGGVLAVASSRDAATRAESPYVLTLAPDGALVSSTPIAGLQGYEVAQVLREGDALVLAGAVAVPAGRASFLARYSLTTHALDPGFGSGGTTVLHVAAIIAGGRTHDSIGGFVAGAFGAGYAISGSVSTVTGENSMAFLTRFSSTGAVLPWPGTRSAPRVVSCGTGPLNLSGFRSIAVDAAGNVFASGDCRRGTVYGPMVAAFRADGSAIEGFGDGPSPGMFVWDFADEFGRTPPDGFAWRTLVDARGDVVVSAERTSMVGGVTKWNPLLLRLRGVVGE